MGNKPTTPMPVNQPVPLPNLPTYYPTAFPTSYPTAYPTQNIAGVVKDYTLDAWEYWSVVFVLVCLFIFVDYEAYLYFCTSSEKEADEDTNGGDKEENIELTSMTSDAGGESHEEGDLESKGYGSTDTGATGIAKDSESSSWTSYMSSFVPTGLMGGGIAEDGETSGDQELVNNTDESNLPELQSFIQPHYIPTTEDGISSGGKKSEESDNKAYSSSSNNSPTKQNRRGSVTSPEEKARRSQSYATCYEELQRLFEEKPRLFFKSLHTPGLKVRGTKELSSAEIKILPLGTVFEVKNLGVSKRGVPRLQLMDGSGWTSYMMADSCEVCVEDVSDSMMDAPMIGGVKVNPDAAHEELNVAEYVSDFYARYNPSKLDDVPYILEKYKGKETELLAKLERQYSRSTDVGLKNEKLEKLLNKLEKKIPDVPRKTASADSGDGN